MSDPQPGDVLVGKYRVERVIGVGGMGIVLAATHLGLEERVALKLMRAEAIGRDDLVQRFLREARAAVRLKSDHVGRVTDVGTLEDGAPYMVMEYLEGQDLSRVLAERGALPVNEAVDYVLQACDAIAEAHARGIIHRDLKPANLFVTEGRDGATLVKVLDFGISKVNVLGDRPESVTSSAALLGSPVYMSPEQMKSSRDVDGTTDIWSIGVILYEAVAGRVPFDEVTMGALMAKVLTTPPPPLAQLKSNLPAGFVAAVHRCLEKEPSDRFATVVELARALAPFGGPGADACASRIAAMRLAPQDTPSTRSSVTGSLPPGEHASIFGVATTQAFTEGGTLRSAGGRARGTAWVVGLSLVGAALFAGAYAVTRTHETNGSTHEKLEPVTAQANAPLPPVTVTTTGSPNASPPLSTPAALAPVPPPTVTPDRAPLRAPSRPSPSASASHASSKAAPPTTPLASPPTTQPVPPPADPFGKSRE